MTKTTDYTLLDLKKKPFPLWLLGYHTLTFLNLPFSGCAIAHTASILLLHGFIMQHISFPGLCAFKQQESILSQF